MVDDQLRWEQIPRDVPDYHERQATHFRELAESATTATIKDRLLKQAEEHELLAEEMVMARGR